jgi:hypothetical protein
MKVNAIFEKNSLHSLIDAVHLVASDEVRRGTLFLNWGETPGSSSDEGYAAPFLIVQESTFHSPEEAP